VTDNQISQCLLFHPMFVQGLRVTRQSNNCAKLQAEDCWACFLQAACFYHLQERPLILRGTVMQCICAQRTMRPLLTTQWCCSESFGIISSELRTPSYLACIYTISVALDVACHLRPRPSGCGGVVVYYHECYQWTMQSNGFVFIFLVGLLRFKNNGRNEESKIVRLERQASSPRCVIF
jgi:hypothetical protein